MSLLTPAMQSALAAKKVLAFGAVRIDLPSYTLCVLNGATRLTFDGVTFLGRDPTFGVLSAVSLIEDTMDDEAPSMSLTFQPPKSSAAAELSSPAFQGSRVRVWVGAIERATGTVVPDPLKLFDGELDQPTLTVGKQIREVEFECVSVFERFFENDEGFRLSDANHQRIWPGERGLEHMTGLTKQIYWGIDRPAGSAGGTSSSWSSGGGFVGAVARNVFSYQ